LLRRPDFIGASGKDGVMSLRGPRFLACASEQAPQSQGLRKVRLPRPDKSGLAMTLCYVRLVAGDWSLSLLGLLSSLSLLCLAIACAKVAGLMN